MQPSLLTGLALFMSGPQLTQLFADLRFTEKVLRESKPAEENPSLGKLLDNAPEEILIEILSRLDGFDLLRCQRVREIPALRHIVIPSITTNTRSTAISIS
jgi:hypothetical protein